MSNSLRALDWVRPLYILPNDPLADEVLIPAFAAACHVDCMVGFFSSSALAALAPGLATFIAKSSNPLRLVISPFLSAEDKRAIDEGLKSHNDVVNEVFEELVVTEELLVQHTLKCLAWLLREGRIEIKVALMEDGLFHPKVWLFRDGDDIMAVHGSSNATYTGVHRNKEQVSVALSWQDAIQRYTAEKLVEQFRQLWEDEEPYCRVIPLPVAARERILRTYNSTNPPTEDDFRVLYKRALTLVNPTVAAETRPPYGLRLTGTPNFRIPHGLRYNDGPYAHQGKAVEAWCRAGYRGVLEMATGSGKTITAMIGAYRLYQEQKPLLIVIAVPYIPLIQQWCDEVTAFGLRPENLSASKGARGRAAVLGQLRRRLEHGRSDVEVVIVSHRTLTDSSFKAELAKFNCARLLIADEAHNLGSEGFISDPPDFFEYRLGLSATPIRQYDEEGTEALFSYFGDVVFRFTLEEAIGLCLVHYDYFVHLVELTPDEMGEWRALTKKIKANAWRLSEDGKPDDYLLKLYRDRRALLETAENKLAILRSLLLAEEPRTIRYTLIYASDKAPEQLEKVNSLLKELGVLFHQLTEAETSDRAKTERIIRSFQEGTLQVLTAKRVLDEGVNIPQIQKAFILASTTVERQWIQRRGRLLRICKEIGKTHSEIHDFIVIPPDLYELDSEARDMIRGELLRVQEFARLARNAARPGGPLDIIHHIITNVFM